MHVILAMRRPRTRLLQTAKGITAVAWSFITRYKGNVVLGRTIGCKRHDAPSRGKSVLLLGLDKRRERERETEEEKRKKREKHETNRVPTSRTVSQLSRVSFPSTRADCVILSVLCIAWPGWGKAIQGDRQIGRGPGQDPSRANAGSPLKCESG